MHYTMSNCKLLYCFFSVLLLFLLSFVSPEPVFAASVTEEAELQLYSYPYPNDPYIDSLWGFENTGSYTHYYGSFPVSLPSTAGIDMKLWEAWEHYPLTREETRTVIVAIIDTGIDYQHPDLRDSMWTNPNEIADNGIDDDGNGFAAEFIKIAILLVVNVSHN